MEINFMRTISLLVLAFLATILCTSGCKKSEQAATGTPPPQGINATEFRPAFAAASPEIKAQVDQVMMNIQSSMHAEALKGLDKLAADTTLTDTQKKAVSDLSEQIKKKLEAAAAPK